MIQPRDEKPEKKPKRAKAEKPPSPQSLLRSIERHLHLSAQAGETSGVDEDSAFQAQQLFYDAMEAESDERELELITKALELDPTNVDALRMVLLNSELKIEEEIEALRMIVALGEKNLGKKTFKEYAGEFWGFIETRPYMRAREQLAEALHWAGRLEEAVAEWEAMLELNPNDNQGVRFSLLACYLTLGRLDGARRLFEKYPNDVEFNTVFAWGKVLERFLAGDLAEAQKSLAAARKQNPHTQAYVKGERKLPQNMPDSYTPGSKEEAVCFADLLQEAWRKHAHALKWLGEQKPA